MTRMQPGLVDWEIAYDREPVASGREPLSPYIEAPSIAEGVTVDEYRRARPPHRKPFPDHQLGRLRHLRQAARHANRHGKDAAGLDDRSGRRRSMTCMSAFKAQHHLQQLQVERAQAWSGGLVSDAAYMTDLDDEIDTTSIAYVAAAVTEIAVLRAELFQHREHE